MIALPVLQPHHQDPDACLMLEVQQGSQEAFEQLFVRHKSWVHRYLTSASDHDQSDDLTQEVFLRVYRSRHGYQPTARFSTWLFTIVSNVARNSIRNSARRHVVPLGYLASPNRPNFSEMVIDSRFESPEYRLHLKEFFALIRRRIEVLNTRQKTALRLFAVDGCSYDQIAAEMGITNQAVKSLLARARGKLTDLLNVEAFE